MRDIGHLFLCWAHPQMMLEYPLNVGDRISVDGILASEPFWATVPALDAHAYVQFGEKSLPFSFSCDTVIVQGEEKRIAFRWRSSLIFPLNIRENRTIYLKTGHSSERSSS